MVRIGLLHQISTISRVAKQCGFHCCFDTGPPRSLYWYSLSAPLKRKLAEDVFEVVGQVGGDDDLLAAARVDEFKLARVQALA